MSFINKVILVTGGSSGIGAATAIAFSKKGANVAIVGRNEVKLNNVVEKCSKVGNTPLSILADLTKEDDTKRIVRTTVESYGKIDVLVNNAGLVRFSSILDSNILKVYDEVMNTNVRSQIYLTHLTAPYLIKSKGNIVNVSSVAGRQFKNDSSICIYSVSKAALSHFSRIMAAEFHCHGVRVNAVSPGPVDTDIMKNAGIEQPFTEIIPTASKPEEIADIILYLASDSANSVTGSDFLIDAGHSLKN